MVLVLTLHLKCHMVCLSVIYCYVTELHAYDLVIKDFVILFVPDPVFEYNLLSVYYGSF